MKPAAKSPRVIKNRRTIGLLIGRLGDIGYAANVWPGVADVAAERDSNLICFVGGALNALHEFDLQRNVIYDLASPENVDGLVAMSGSLGQFVGPERVLRYYDRFRPLPMVSVAMALEGIPAVLVDNAAGVREAITHLIEVHGFRRIAFIRGPATNTEAEERFQTYREVLDEHHLPFDAGLVTDGNYLADRRSGGGPSPAGRAQGVLRGDRVRQRRNGDRRDGRPAGAGDARAGGYVRHGVRQSGGSPLCRASAHHRPPAAV